MMLVFRNLLLGIFFTLLPALAWSQGDPVLSTPFTPAAGTTTVRAVFRKLKAATGLSISYSALLIDPSRKVVFTGNEKNVGEVLDIILTNVNATAVVRQGNILIVPEGESTTAYRKKNLDGYIKDKETKEVLIACTIYSPRDQISTITNSFGFYSLSLKEGEQQLLVFYPGYKKDTITVNPAKNNRIDILLAPTENALEEVNISASADEIEDQGNHDHLNSEEISLPQAVLGEKDVLRSLQMLPGVQSGLEGSSNITVRGGDPGQNLFLLDGIPLYYVDHFYGFTSVYNTQAIKSVDFYKGAFPSRYSGRLSSIVDVHTKDGDMERIGGEFTFGLAKATLNLEGPIIKDKVSFLVSGRRSWIDPVLTPFSVSMYFYDINAKLNWVVNENNRVYISFYNGRDQILYDPEDEYSRTRWGNRMISVKWNSILNSKFFLNTTATYSQFRYEINEYQKTEDTVQENTINNYTGISTISEMALHIKGQWYPHYRHAVEMGIGYSHSQFTPTKLVNSGNANIPVPVNPVSNEFAANEATAYVEDKIKLGDKWMLRPGLHLARWFNSDFGYTSLQPRLFASYKLSQSQQLTGSFSYMTQFLHLISNNSYGLPNNFWIPSTNLIRPEQSLMTTIGYHAKMKKLKYSIEGYYKRMDGVITYTTGKNIFDNSDRWQNKIIQGKGTSYGAEFSVEDKFGPLMLQAAYTLSKHTRQFDEINGGNAFPYRYDRRHVIKAGLYYQPSQKVNIALNWTFMSGEAFTLPDQIYPDLDNNLLIFPTPNNKTANYTYNYVKWNDYRLPAIHHLDIGVDFVKRKRKHYERTWSIGIYNVYARPNIMFVTLGQNDENGAFELKGISALQFLPYFSYQMKF